MSKRLLRKLTKKHKNIVKAYKWSSTTFNPIDNLIPQTMTKPFHTNIHNMNNRNRTHIIKSTMTISYNKISSMRIVFSRFMLYALEINSLKNLIKENLNLHDSI